MSFWKKLFGLGGGQGEGAGAGAPSRTETHAGFTIAATPYENGGRWQLCGVISKEVDGEAKEHRFIRADTFNSREEAEQMTFFKARQMIDQMGDGVLLQG